ncbi:MAG: carbon-nitrogen hydrolase family protein [Candidatus Promineifilaceae bacterium]
MLTSPNAAAVQMQCLLGEPEANLAQAEALLAPLAGRVHFACLPELCTTGYNLAALGPELERLAEPVPGPSTERLARLARQWRMALIFGLAERDPAGGRPYDTAVILSANGELAGRYRKSHLHPAEVACFAPGDELPVFQVDGLRVGVAICFEHAFPHIFTTLALRGAQIIFNPSAVPVGFGYLQALRSRARAQDNQLFVVAANHVGAEGDVVYCGQSQIADPRGRVVALAPEEGQAAVSAPLALELIGEQRRQEPVFAGFRPKLYEP